MSDTSDSPRIIRPTDGNLLRRLHAKLAEYKARIHPELLNATSLPAARQQETYERLLDVPQLDAILKYRVLNRILTAGVLVTWDLARELAIEYGQYYDVRLFINACAVIDTYISDGSSENVLKGSLPE